MDSVEQQVLGAALAVVSFCLLYHIVHCEEKWHPIWRVLLGATCGGSATFVLFGDWMLVPASMFGLIICCAGISFAKLAARREAKRKNSEAMQNHRDESSSQSYDPPFNPWLCAKGIGVPYGILLGFIRLGWGTDTFFVAPAVAATTIMASLIFICASRDRADLGHSLVWLRAGGVYTLIALVSEVGGRMLIQALSSQGLLSGNLALLTLSWEAAASGIMATVLIVAIASFATVDLNRSVARATN